ncbi:MAG TPA: ABC transporter permease subunit [Anaerolineae bacterium]|nr:ABC transporter permease subunit [Anaerolineae bacterium]HPL26416.1 ABC transporter permease subunit [Anaerolineae bacterium]
MTAESSPRALLQRPFVQAILRRLLSSLVILLAIAYLAQFGLLVAERGRAGLPAEPLDAAFQALARTGSYLAQHPSTYLWHKAYTPAFEVVGTLFARSAALLVLAVAVAGIIGVPLGIAVALLRRRGASTAILLLSILGVSTPSFLLAMLLWILNTKIFNLLSLSKALLPPTGFGWDAHLVMPVLVLAVRPLAQIVQVTYVAMAGVLSEDYIRTAQAKGLAWRVVLMRHALRNVLTPILTTLGTSLRFSLASLPVVESFFLWPGIGQTLLETISKGPAALVTDLLVALGAIFLLINLALELIYRIVDPRLRQAPGGEEQEERRSWREELADASYALKDVVLQVRELGAGLLRRLPGAHRPAQPVRKAARQDAVATRRLQATEAGQARRSDGLRNLRIALGNPALILGTLLVLGFFGLALFGEQLTAANPYQTNNIMTIEGKTGGPPFAPSSVFPWGSDIVGRDMQALVLAGAKQTLALALAATLARVLLGTVLGLLAGWWRGGWFERLVNGMVAVWAAFPVTLFAMIAVLALGIEQGMGVFVAALCIVGWGEIAQYVRAQVIGIKPKLYIEAARSVGARPNRILTWHVLPQLLVPLLVLAVLEMGGMLMLLAELGFLNIFLGGGFKVELLGTGLSGPSYHFSDVPEWGALLANVRNWWRSYPWLAWSPGLAIFLAILTFNLWGEGLRRFMAESRLNVARLVNRYTMVTGAVLVLGLGWAVRSTAPIELYRPEAVQFDTSRVMADIEVLASPEFGGRETGTPGARAAADYIARRMEEVGLFPTGDDNTFIQSTVQPRYHLVETPLLEILDSSGAVAEQLVHRQDFAEYTGRYGGFGEDSGQIVGLALGPAPDTGKPDAYGLRRLNLGKRVVIVRNSLPTGFDVRAAAGVLIVSDDLGAIQEKRLFGSADLVTWDPQSRPPQPTMIITPELAERLLATAGSSLAELDRMAQGLGVGEAASTNPGASVHLEIALELDDSSSPSYFNVIGHIPGTGAQMGRKGEALDNDVILISAYYDGPGTDPDGMLFPGANDNASGVAAMLEMARLLKASPYQPKKTVVFVAWTGGERAEGLSVKNVMNAKGGFGMLRVEAVLELSSLGGGSGKAIALGQGTSFSLVQLFQDAAGRLRVPVTTRGRGPHFGQYTASGFGGRSALSAYVSWDGSDRLADTPADTPEAIEPDKLKRAGQTVLLVVHVLSRETNY